MQFKDLYPYKVFYKKQYRKKNKPELSRQLVVKDEKRWINMEARTINCQLYKIYGWVRREKKAAQKYNDENGDVPIRNEDTGEILNLIKDTDKPTPIPHGILVGANKILKTEYNCKILLVHNGRDLNLASSSIIK